MIKFNCKGRVLAGQYSPNGEILIEDTIEETGGYYIYMWPKDGTTWLNSEDEIVYDAWLENLDRVKSYIKNQEWEIEWQEDEENKK